MSLSAGHKKSAVEPGSETPGALYVEDVGEQVVHEVNDNADFQDVVRAAQRQSQQEQSMSLMQGLRTYPKAMGWSIALSTCIIMEGYDTIILGNFYGMPAFNKKYGTLDAATGKYSLSAAWQDGLSDGAGVGEILGLFISGWLADIFGYKRVLGGSLIMITCFIFINFFAVNLAMLQVGEILCGIPWGVFQTITTTYAAEVCPVNLRAYLTTYVNLCWVIGQLLASGVLRGTLSLNSQWSYKIPFAIQWIWPVPIFIAVCLAPESPWWLIRKGRVEDAERAVARLGSKGDNFSAKDTVAFMAHTNEVEKRVQSGTSYLDCFKGPNFRRTEISCITWVCQQVCGSSFMGNSTYFYEQAGLATSNSFDMTIGQFALGAIGTVASWFLMTKVGRRTIYVWGLFTLTVVLLTIGFLGVPHQNTGLSWAVGSLLLIYTFIYDFTVGPVCYSLVAELPSSRLRQKTVVLARNLYNIFGAAYTGVIGLYMLNPTAWNWGPKAAFFWAGNCALCFVWAYFRLPEPKGRTYAELDILFDKKVPARKFASTQVDPYEIRNAESDVERLNSTEKI